MCINLLLIVGDQMRGGYKTLGLKNKHNIYLSLVWGLYTIINWVSLCDCHIQSLAFFFLHFNFCFTAFLTDCNSKSFTSMLTHGNTFNYKHVFYPSIESNLLFNKTFWYNIFIHVHHTLIHFNYKVWP